MPDSNRHLSNGLLNAQPMSCMLVDCEVYMVHPCLLDKARNSQPCSSCGLPSVLPSLPFGLRDPRQINAALVPAQLAPQIHKTFSPVSGLGTRRCTADPGSAIPSAVALGQKGRTLFMGFPSCSPEGKPGLSVPLSPSLGLSYTDLHLLYAHLYMFQM